jgi:hypothetical protein
LSQRAVWERTLAHVPVLNRYYWQGIPRDEWPRLENPDRTPPPGLF